MIDEILYQQNRSHIRVSPMSIYKDSLSTYILTTDFNRSPIESFFLLPSNPPCLPKRFILWLILALSSSET